MVVTGWLDARPLPCELVRKAWGDEAPAFTILTAYGTVESAREALKAGVYDYLTKPVNPAELSVLLKNVLEKARLRRENRALSRAVGARSIADRLVGASPAFEETLSLSRAAADRACPARRGVVSSSEPAITVRPWARDQRPRGSGGSRPTRRDCRGCDRGGGCRRFARDRRASP